jgi:hypothetical protein
MSLPFEHVAIVECASCDEELQHCHGTAIMIDGATHACSDDPDCTLEAAEHWFVSMDELSIAP